MIGKLSAAADVILPYRTVSRLHAKLVSTEEGDYLLDLNSRNGTTVNGVPLMGETKKKLEDGDDISFAGKKYRYKAGEKTEIEKNDALHFSIWRKRWMRYFNMAE